MLQTEVQVLAVHVVGDMIDGANTREDAVGEAAQCRRQLVTPGAAQRIPSLGFDADNGPVFDTEGGRSTIQNDRLCHPVHRVPVPWACTKLCCCRPRSPISWRVRAAALPMVR